MAASKDLISVCKSAEKNNNLINWWILPNFPPPAQLDCPQNYWIASPLRPPSFSRPIPSPVRQGRWFLDDCCIFHVVSNQSKAATYYNFYIFRRAAKRLWNAPRVRSAATLTVAPPWWNGQWLCRRNLFHFVNRRRKKIIWLIDGFYQVPPPTQLDCPQNPKQSIVVISVYLRYLTILLYFLPN